jgi:hypothetical protein
LFICPIEQVTYIIYYPESNFYLSRSTDNVKPCGIYNAFLQREKLKLLSWLVAIFKVLTLGTMQVEIEHPLKRSRFDFIQNNRLLIFTFDKSGSCSIRVFKPTSSSISTSSSSSSSSSSTTENRNSA